MFNIGSKYWTYNLQPDYLFPFETNMSYWQEHESNTIYLDPGDTVIIQGQDQGPLIWSTYFVNQNPLLSLYGIIVNYFNPANLEGLDASYLYATVTNLGKQSIVLLQSDYILTINTFGLM